VGAVALVISGGAVAADLTYTSRDFEVCGKMSEGARAIMGMRQQGVEATDAMGLLGFTATEYAQEVRSMIQAAYRQPQRATPNERAAAVGAFAQQVDAACRQTIGDHHRNRGAETGRPSPR
ncbi:hypothetical protein, partial [Achromobacter sp.]|uniref:hypothetical protein n=1 Tax=Achromobacter sp. TaxID=134375 RepID=UPI0028A768C3